MLTLGFLWCNRCTNFVRYTTKAWQSAMNARFFLVIDSYQKHHRRRRKCPIHPSTQPSIRVGTLVCFPLWSEAGSPALHINGAVTCASWMERSRHFSPATLYYFAYLQEGKKKKVCEFPLWLHCHAFKRESYKTFSSSQSGLQRAGNETNVQEEVCD